MARALVNTIKDTRKNYIINGDMSFAQRGTSFAAIANTAYSLDRWQYVKSGAMVHTVTQDTDVPTLAQAGYLFQSSLRANLTTPDTSIAAGDYCVIRQQIEGYNWANIAQKAVTLSFWVKATLAGTYCVALQNSGGDRSYVAEYTINTTNTWEYKTVTMLASPSTGTWNYASGVGISVYFTLAAGTTYQTTAGAWQTGNFATTAAAVNGVNTGATDFRITGVKLAEGSSPSTFSLFGLDRGGELAACQRYYEKSFSIEVTPGTVTTNGALYFMGVGSQNRPFVTIFYKQNKRASAVHTLYSARTGASGTTNAIWDANAGATEYTAAVGSGATHSFTINPQAVAVPPVSAQLIVHWAAEAEL